MTCPKCLRCGKPLVLFVSFDEPGDWELSCSSRWKPGFQDDAAFQVMWDNLPGDWVVRLEKQIAKDIANAS